MPQHRLWTVAWVVGLIVVTGCGRGPRLVPVTGTVKMDGRPLAEATVQLVYSEYPRQAAGRTDAEGKFSLSYHNKPGAPIGPCKVVIHKMGTVADATGSKELIPPKYNRETQLQIEVTKKGPNEFNFDMTSDPNMSRPAPAVPNEPDEFDIEMPVDDENLFE